MPALGWLTTYTQYFRQDKPEDSGSEKLAGVFSKNSYVVCKLHLNSPASPQRVAM